MLDLTPDFLVTEHPMPTPDTQGHGGDTKEYDDMADDAADDDDREYHDRHTLGDSLVAPPEEEEVLEYHEEVGLIDGEVDEGDLHVKVTSKKSLTEVSHSYLVSSGFLLRCMSCYCLEYFETN